MAAKPHMTVRLAPSMLHGLQFIAERETVAPAELARTIISASVREYLSRRNLQEQCQDAYMAWLAARGKHPAGAGPADDGGVIDITDGEYVELDVPRPVEPIGPYGPIGDQLPRVDYSEQAPRALSAIVTEADRLVAQTRPDGRKRRS